MYHTIRHTGKLKINTSVRQEERTELRTLSPIVLGFVQEIYRRRLQATEDIVLFSESSAVNHDRHDSNAYPLHQIAILRRAYTIALKSISAYLLTMMISWILIAYSVYDLWRLMPAKGRIYGHVSNSTKVSLFYKYYGRYR